MPRGTKRKNYSSELVEKALKAIEDNDLSVYAAAQNFSIPESTLRDKMKGKHQGAAGRKTILTEEEEKELIDWVLECSAMGDPKTKQEILNAATEIVQLADDPKRSFKNGIPTYQWINGLLKRHSNVSMRTPESISRASALVSQSNIERFFDDLYKWMKNYFSEEELQELLSDPSRWANSDETGFEINAKPKRVLAKKGAKTVYLVDSSKPKEKVTVTYTFLADGSMIDPVITFKDSCSKITDIAYALGSVNAQYGLAQTDSGWQTVESFFNFVSKYLDKEFKKRNIKRPIMYFVDGHVSHVSYRLRKWCKENGIILIAFYPNATHILQMCDTTMFSPLKKGWLKEIQAWKKSTGCKEVDEVEFVKLLKNINDKYIKKESIVNGFASTGIFPFNKLNVHYERCLGENFMESEDHPLEENLSAHVSDSNIAFYSELEGGYSSNNSDTHGQIEFECDDEFLRSLNLSGGSNFAEQSTYLNYTENNGNTAESFEQIEFECDNNILEQSEPVVINENTIEHNSRVNIISIDNISGPTQSPENNINRQYKTLINNIENNVAKLSEIISSEKPQYNLNVSIIKQQLEFLKQNDTVLELNKSTSQDMAYDSTLSENRNDVDDINTTDAEAEAPKTIANILQKPQKPKRSGKKRLKMKTYGVLSSDEAISVIEAEEEKKKQAEEAKRVAKEEREAKKAEEEEMKKQIKELQQNLKEFKSKNTKKRSKQAPTVASKKSKNQTSN